MPSCRRTSLVPTLLALLGGAGGTGCVSTSQDAAGDSFERAMMEGGFDVAARATAVLRDTSGAEIGTVRLVEDSRGRLHVAVVARGLSPGRHGIHFNAVGSCVAPAFASAGGHHDASGRAHGLYRPDGPHDGDLPNLEVGGTGVAHMEIATQRLRLRGGAAPLLDADGTAVVIDAREDDQISNPSGNSGARIACGVLEG
jgi:Cu-Zn family superoxide dismutase